MSTKRRAWHEADQDLVSWADAYGPSTRALADHHATADRPKERPAMHPFGNFASWGG